MINEIILPKKSLKEIEINSPVKQLQYLIYLPLTWVIVSLILTSYSRLLTAYVGPENSGREFMICGGQILFQLLVLIILKENRKSILLYLANMMTISLAGAFALLARQIFADVWSQLPPFISVLYFMFIAGLMFLEHLRRMKVTGFPKILSLTWVIYRVLVLLLLITIN